MKNLLLAASALSLASCTALGGPTPDQVAKQVSDILADQVVSQEELDGLKATITKVNDSAKSTDWGSILGTVAGAALTAVLGVKILPTRALQGPFDPKPPVA